MQPHIERIRREHPRPGANGPEVIDGAAAILQAFALTLEVIAPDPLIEDQLARLGRAASGCGCAM